MSGSRIRPARRPSCRLQFVELLAEFVVVGSQCLDDVPHRLERRVVEGDLGVFVGVDEDGDDDGADGLVCGEPDGAADRLHDVDLGAAGVDERHAVEGGYVDALGEAACVGEQPAFAVVESGEVSQQHVALAGGHLARGVVGPQRVRWAAGVLASRR